MSQKTIREVKKNLGKGVTVNAKHQGHFWNTKVLRALDAAGMPKHQYAAYCKKALQENPRALRWVDPDKVGGGPDLHYALICEEAVAKDPLTLEYVQAEKMPLRCYFSICMKAARHEYIDAAMRYVKDELLTDAEYIQVCLEAVLHGVDTIKNIRHERLSREDYLKICWVSVIRSPRTVNYMYEPTPELRLMAARGGGTALRTKSPADINKEG